jgi:hypothetical protein
MVGRPGLSILHPAGDLLRGQEGGIWMLLGRKSEGQVYGKNVDVQWDFAERKG